MKDYSFELSVFKQANSISAKGGTVIFSSGNMARMPIAEMAMNSMISNPVYNRGIAGLTIEDACGVLDQCVYALEPHRVIVALGSEDLKSPAFELDAFMYKYAKLIDCINSHIRGHVYIASVISDNPEAERLNGALRDLAHSSGFRFIDLSCSVNCDNPLLRMFDIMRNNLRERPISFAEALSLPV